jgi:hypothetical protein
MLEVPPRRFASIEVTGEFGPHGFRQNRYMAVGAGSKSDVDRPAVRRRPAANRRGQSQLPHDTLALVLLEPLTPHCVFNSVPWHCQGTFLPTRTS